MVKPLKTAQRENKSYSAYLDGDFKKKKIKNRGAIKTFILLFCFVKIDMGVNLIYNDFSVLPIYKQIKKRPPPKK